jgi:hypothetical protein
VGEKFHLSVLLVPKRVRVGVKQKTGTVKIANPEPGGKRYTSEKAALGMVRRGVAKWATQEKKAIRVIPPSLVSISEESRRKLQEESLIGRVSFEWHPKMSGGVKVWQAKKRKR